MRALCHRRYGPPAVLEFEDLPIPALAADEVLVRVHFTSVNPVDWKNVAGKFRFLTRGLGTRKAQSADILSLVMFQEDYLRRLTEPIDECETELWLLTHPEARHLRRIGAVYAHLAQAVRLP